jgi:hypothetical protein
MKTLLTEYRTGFRDRVLDLLWRQWIALGVAGHGEQWRGSPIDPEALLLATCTVGRFDARLFDAMIEWMGVNGQYINVQRLKRIISTEEFAGEQVVRAVAATVSNSVSAAKWATTRTARGSDGTAPLFFLKDGRPMPTVKELDPVFKEHGLLRDNYESRGVVQAFRPESASNLVLRLRAFMGVNARCEIITYLLLNEQGSPSSLARETYYFPLTISKAMAEMRDSGYLTSRVNGRRRDHRLGPATWRDLLLGNNQVQWVVWPRVFRAIEAVWLFLWDDALLQKEPLPQASSLRRVLLKSIVDRTETCGLDYSFGDITAHPGEQLIPFAEGRISAFLDVLEQSAGLGK